jgi:hypothetical protein
MNMLLLRHLIRETLIAESSAARRAQTRAITGDRNTKLEIWQLADSLITTPPSAHFTMTSIQKVGLNPGSRYNTPLALYAYPVTDHTVDQLMGVFEPDAAARANAGETITAAKAASVAKNKADFNKGVEDDIKLISQFTLNELYHRLPFVETAPYINFFRLQPDGVFYTSIGMTQAEYDAGMANLTAYVSQNDVGTEKRYGTPDEAMQQIVAKAMSFHRITGALNDQKRLKVAWTTTRGWAQRLADQVQAGDAEGMSPRALVMWRRLLMEMGIKAVCDDAGTSLVHEAEPTQTAVMDTSIVEIIQQFENRTPAVDRAGRERSDLQKKEYEFNVGGNLAIVTAALKDSNTVNMYPRERALLSSLKVAQESGENSFIPYLAFEGFAAFEKFVQVEQKTGKRFPFLSQLFRDMIVAVPDHFSQKRSKFWMTFAALLNRGTNRQEDQDLVASYLISIAKHLQEQYANDPKTPMSSLQEGLLDFLGPERYPQYLAFLESRQDVQDAFKALMSSLSTNPRWAGELAHDIRMIASGAAPHLYPAFRKIFVEEGWPADRIEIDGHDYAAENSYVISQATAFEDVEQSRKVSAEKRAAKDKAVAAYWAASSDSLADDEPEEWNPPKEPALKSIYKDPKFVKKHGTKRSFSSYSDEDDA